MTKFDQMTKWPNSEPCKQSYVPLIFTVTEKSSFLKAGIR